MTDHLATGTGDNSAARLKSYIERIKNLQAEKKAKNAEFTADIKAVADEAKAAGYDAKVVKEIAKLLQQQEDDADALSEKWAVLELYGKTAGLDIFS